MILIGDGKLRDQLADAARGLPVVLPGYCADRFKLARLLASADIYVSAMADETFGLSVLEAQACGLPVVGFASGAMVQRVPKGLGELVDLDDVAAMARAVAAVCAAMTVVVTWEFRGAGMASLSVPAGSTKLMMFP